MGKVEHFSIIKTGQRPAWNWLKREKQKAKIIYFVFLIGEKFSGTNLQKSLAKIFNEDKSFFRKWFLFIVQTNTADEFLIIKLLILNGIDNG